MVNTCSLRGGWSSANLFTHRLTTQEPLFLPLPSRPPSIPRYLTFPSPASPASRLPWSSPPCLFCLFQTLPRFLLPVFSSILRWLPDLPATPFPFFSCQTHPYGDPVRLHLLLRVTVLFVEFPLLLALFIIFALPLFSRLVRGFPGGGRRRRPGRFFHLLVVLVGVEHHDAVAVLENRHTSESVSPR